MPNPAKSLTVGGGGPFPLLGPFPACLGARSLPVGGGGGGGSPFPLCWVLFLHAKGLEAYLQEEEEEVVLSPF